jgi:hypothetical protein
LGRTSRSRRSRARLLRAPEDFRFLCGVEWREGRVSECFLRYPPEYLSGDKARAVAHTFRAACSRRRCRAVYVHNYDAVKAAVRRALASGRRELILGEDL